MKRTYTLAELEAMPTLAIGQTDDLKIETSTMRVWLSRMTKEDGEPYNNKVTIEEYRGQYESVKRPDYRSTGKHGRWVSPSWVITREYQAI